MASPDEPKEKMLSRRRFLQSAGALAVGGVVTMELGGFAGRLLRSSTEKEPSRIGVEVPRASAPQYLGTPIAVPMAAPTTFSIFWITDTQFLSESNPALFQTMTSWIADNWASYNGKMVIHTGDLVEHGDTPGEWKNADAAMSILAENGIPYTWCAGNHDDYSNGDPTSGWIGNTTAASLDPDVVSGQVNALGYASWVGDYHDGMNTAVAFSALDLNFLIINIEWNAQPDVLRWVEGLLADPKYGGYRVIMAPHAYMDYQGNLDDAKWGSTLSAFVGGLTPLMDANSSNIFLTLNGHFATDCGYNTPKPIHNRNQLMFDRQDCTDEATAPTGRGADQADTDPAMPDSAKIGGATVMILTFDPDENQITARTYDVYTGKWRTDADEQYGFTMFSGPPPDSSGEAGNSGKTSGIRDAGNPMRIAPAF
jgi:hypothetical protein